jgi:hypothetical protein
MVSDKLAVEALELKCLPVGVVDDVPSRQQQQSHPHCPSARTDCRVPIGSIEAQLVPEAVDDSTHGRVAERVRRAARMVRDDRRVAMLLCPILIVAEPVTAEVRLPAASADEQRLARIEHREHADEALDEDERVVVAHHPPARAAPRLAPVHDHKQLEHLMREAIRGHHQRPSSEAIIRGHHQRPSSEAIIRGHHQRPSSEAIIRGHQKSMFW